MERWAVVREHSHCLDGGHIFDILADDLETQVETVKVRPKRANSKDIAGQKSDGDGFQLDGKVLNAALLDEGLQNIDDKARDWHRHDAHVGTVTQGEVGG